MGIRMEQNEKDKNTEENIHVYEGETYTYFQRKWTPFYYGLQKTYFYSFGYELFKFLTNEILH